jgi:phosphoribosylanthranilate isomerase
MKIKICGLSDNAESRSLEPLNEIDYFGFIFHPNSTRFTEQSFVTNKKKVGVFVNAALDVISRHIEEHQLSVIQLHGDETPEFIAQLPSEIEIIKAIGIESKADLESCKAYENCIHYFLFDTKSTQHGGTGSTFDWELLNAYTGTIPFFLSGGLGPETIGKLNQFSHPKWVGIDLNSRFETAPTLKNKQLIYTFIQQLTV